MLEIMPSVNCKKAQCDCGICYQRASDAKNEADWLGDWFNRNRVLSGLDELQDHIAQLRTIAEGK
jgi:hypothetical protein